MLEIGAIPSLLILVLSGLDETAVTVTSALTSLVWNGWGFRKTGKCGKRFCGEITITQYYSSRDWQ